MRLTRDRHDATTTPRLRPWYGLLVLANVACARAEPSALCMGEADCVARARAVPATSRRLLYDPVDVAYVSRRSGNAGTPAFATLGADDGAAVLLRFSIELPPEARILEAFILLDRATRVDAVPGVVTLRAGRITQAWDSRSVSFAQQPRVEETGGLPTRVPFGGGSQVRLDVSALVRRWLRRGRDEFGIEVEADGPGQPGMTLDLAASSGPHLELYVK